MFGPQIVTLQIVRYGSRFLQQWYLWTDRYAQL